MFIVVITIIEHYQIYFSCTINSMVKAQFFGVKESDFAMLGTLKQGFTVKNKALEKW